MTTPTTRTAGPPRRVLLAALTHPATRLAVLGVLAVAGGLVAATVDDTSLSGVRASLADLGPLAPVVFVVVYAVATAVVLPASPFTVLAGVLFGPSLGVVTALAGAVGSAVLGFLLGRWLGRGALERVAGARVATLDELLVRRGTTTVLLVRLVPILPLNVVNLACGVAAVRLRSYVLGTAVGIVPSVVALVTLGDTVRRPASAPFLLAALLLATLTVVGGLVARRLDAPRARPPRP